METALNKTTQAVGRYGSTTHKQVYVYGRLDPSPTELAGSFGMAWGMGGWLIFPYLQTIGPAAAQRLRERVAAQLKTTFASQYARTVSLAEALQPQAISVYSKRATNEKYLIAPNKDVPA
jgi:NADPH2:quinone reductase